MKTEPTESLSIKRANIVDKYLPAVDQQRYYQRLEMHEELIDLINIHSPKIKQLEWMVGEGTETILANIPFNNYYLIDGLGSMIFLTINTQYHIGRYATIEEAKAAARADFEKMVMECLDIADNSNK